ncbi:Hpt domain-containing protein [Puniceicoccaceae bacterium K14]|nr:Hpt domain-containing protein [Puniceicoccaceae bacterium K14]
MSDSELIDWEQLEMVFGDEDDFDEDMAELFQEFVEDANDHFTQISAEDFESSRELVAKLAHKVKGSCANFGFNGVATSLASIENGIADLALDTFNSLLATAKSDFQKSLEEVHSRYPALSA